MGLILPIVPDPLGSIGTFPETNWRWSRNGADSNTPIDVVQDVTSGSGKALSTKVIGDGAATYRAEISGNSANSPNGTNRGIIDGMERWVGFSVMCSSTSPLLNTFNTTIFQVLQSGGGTWEGSSPGFAGPCMHISMSRGRYLFGQAWDTNLNSTDLNVIKHIESVNIGNCLVDTWTRFVVHWIPNSTGSGLTEVYRDGRLVYRNDTDPNNYNQPPAAQQYIKLGNYTSSWRPPTNSTNGATTSWYHDQIMIGDSTSSLAEMMSIVNSPIPQSIEGYSEFLVQ